MSTTLWPVSIHGNLRVLKRKGRPIGVPLYVVGHAEPDQTGNRLLLEDFRHLRDAQRWADANSVPPVGTCKGCGKKALKRKNPVGGWFWCPRCFRGFGCTAQAGRRVQ